MTDMNRDESDVTAGWIQGIARAPRRALLEWFAIMERELQYVTGEIALVRGLVPILACMRQSGLTPVQRSELFAHLRRVYVLGPYLVFALLPGSFLAIPLVALWRDRRRRRAAHRAADAA
ncbi:MAG: hypothetical protein JNM90_01675 [Burkholderiales bacterium]|nr:hypothetical protein [Burkholderiales bacterium]